MRKQELVALRLSSASFQDLVPKLYAAFTSLGIAEDADGRDGTLTVRDHGGDRGCTILLSKSDLGQRAARALASQIGARVQVYVVNGTDSGARYRFRAAAYEASPDGAIKDASGVELDFEDDQQDWGGGDLNARAHRVLQQFGALPRLKDREQSIGYKQRAAGKPSSPRVATLLALLKKARSWEGVPMEDGRVQLKVEIASGGKQSSFCTAAEFEELKKLTGR
jgi:hypothetical protein